MNIVERRHKPEDRRWITGWVDYERELVGVNEALDFLPVIMQRLRKEVVTGDPITPNSVR